MRADAVAFLGHLVFQVKEARQLLDGHLDANSDQFLPFLFLGDVTIWMTNRFLHEGADDTILNELLKVIELGLETDSADVDELIAVSFLENLPYPTERGAEIVKLLGPKLRRRLAQMRPQQLP